MELACVRMERTELGSNYLAVNSNLFYWHLCAAKFILFFIYFFATFENVNFV